MKLVKPEGLRAMRTSLSRTKVFPVLLCLLIVNYKYKEYSHCVTNAYHSCTSPVMCSILQRIPYDLCGYASIQCVHATNPFS